jgi:hypothetical protein
MKKNYEWTWTYDTSKAHDFWAQCLFALCLVYTYLFIAGPEPLGMVNLAVVVIDAIFVLDYLNSRFAITNTTLIGGKSVWFPRPDHEDFRK